jgi:hypothetical protein
MSLLREPGDYFALKTISGDTLGLVSLFDDGVFQICIYIYIYIYIYIHTNTHARTHTHTHIYHD